LARVEAKNAFASDELIQEAALIRPRHVEVQLFADRHGNVVHMGERDCSTQRRHQKLIEEAPSPAVNAKIRAEMGAAAIAAAKAVDFEGAGTVEFLLDEDGNFYFLEMNTRLQVEHPVSEMVTGLDLVAMQFEVATGLPLSVAQADIDMQGHAIEARLYAEDPHNNFLPDSGMIDLWRAPFGEGIRVDDGIRSGQNISPYYDPMLAKIIAHGPTREVARARLVKALQDCVLFGIKSNRDFLIELLNSTDFASGTNTTALIGENYGPVGPDAPEITFHDAALLAALLFKDQQEKSMEIAKGCAPELLGWGSAGSLHSRIVLSGGAQKFALRLQLHRDGALEIQAGDESVMVHWRAGKLWLDSVLLNITASHRTGPRLYLCEGARTLEMAIVSGGQREQAIGNGQIKAPMHGNLQDIPVKKGDRVAKGQRIAVLEAMKLQHEILADRDGVVLAAHSKVGQQVQAGDLLIEIDAANDDGDRKG
jgi:geranyl-CoA carboxylase alpha subunit